MSQHKTYPVPIDEDTIRELSDPEEFMRPIDDWFEKLLDSAEKRGMCKDRRR